MSDCSNVIFIGIAGPSGSGKSTYAKHLVEHLHSPLSPIQLDHFFIRKLTIDHPILGRITSSEQPDCLHIKAFFTLLYQIKQNPKTITQYHREDILKNENEYIFIIIEGFLLFALSDEITNLIDIRIFLDSTLSECRIRRYRRRHKIIDTISNENIIVSDEFQQWFDYLVWDEYLKRRHLQIENSEKIFHWNEYQQKQYTQLDIYIEQRLKQIIEHKNKHDVGLTVFDIIFQHLVRFPLNYLPKAISNMNISTKPSLILFPLPDEVFMDYIVGKPIHTNTSITISSNYYPLHRFIIRCFSLYALALVVIGTFGNILTIIILCRRNLRRYVTMRYLIAVGICDIISLYGWNLNNFYKFTISNNDDNLEELSLIHCRIISYLSFVGLQLSSWCLTAVSLDRCLSLHFLTWKQEYGKLSRTKYHIAILATICLLLNCHILFLNGYHTGPPDNTIQCYATRTNPYYIFPKWERVHLVVYNLCPFIIMLSCNIYIIYITIHSARIRSSGKGSRSNTTRHRQLSIMLMIVTFAFVVLTLPSCLYFVFFRHRMSSSDSSRSYRYMVQICLSSVQFTSHAINFFLYCFSATNFRNELRDFIGEICFCRSIRIKSNKTSLTAMKLTTFSQDKRNIKNINPKSTLENQNALKDISAALINREHNCNHDSISN